MHISIGSIINEILLFELRRKTYHELEGRALTRKCVVGKAYGYNNAGKYDLASNLIPGDCEINIDEVATVERIYCDYVKDKSPRNIAFKLNKDGVPCPSGKAWGATMVYGNRHRNTDIVNDELYIGLQIWNKQRYVGP